MIILNDIIYFVGKKSDIMYHNESIFLISRQVQLCLFVHNYCFIIPLLDGLAIKHNKTSLRLMSPLHPVFSVLVCHISNRIRPTAQKGLQTLF